MYKINTTYDDKTILDGAKLWLKITNKWDYLISPILLVIIAFGVLTTENIGFFEGIALTIGILYFLIVYGLWIYLPKHSVKAWRKAGLNNCEWTFDEDYFEIKSNLETRQVPWTSLKKMILYKDYWFFVYQTKAHSSLPMKNINSDILIFIRNKAKENNVLIKDNMKK